MTMQTVLPVDLSAVAALSSLTGEPEWMAALRRESLELAANLPLPKLEKTRIERWPLDDFGSYKESPRLKSAMDLPAEVRRFIGDAEKAGNLLVQRNSSVVYAALSDNVAAKGVVFTGLSDALAEHGELIRRHFMKAVARDENRLTALHAAMWSGGVFLYVPKNVKVEVPLQALFLSDDASASFCPHVLIVADENSEVTYVDNYFNYNASGKLVHNGVVEIFAKPGAHVQFASVHDLSAGVTDLTYRRAVLENGARIDWIIGEMNNGHSMSDTASILKGEGSVSDAKVICVGTGDQRMNITTRAVHIGRHTVSDMITRAVMRDNSTAIINGITKIEKGATYASGEQTERVLMLSPTARGDANPMLLIDEDEVKAGHAASVGQVNPEHVFYMMSRGITREAALRLIIYGFLAPVVSEIPIRILEEQLKLVVERKLGQ